MRSDEIHRDPPRSTEILATGSLITEFSLWESNYSLLEQLSYSDAYESLGIRLKPILKSKISIADNPNGVGSVSANQKFLS